MHAGLFTAGQRAELPIAAGRHAYVQVVRGRVRINGAPLSAGDGAALSGEPSVQVEGVEGGEVLVFDLA